MKNEKLKMKSDKPQLKTQALLSNFKFFIVIFIFSFLLLNFDFARGQNQFVHISWRVLNALQAQDVRNLPVDGSLVSIGVTHQIIEDDKILQDSDVDFIWRIEPERGYIVPRAPQFVFRVDQAPGQNQFTVNLKIKSKITNTTYQKS